MKRLGYEGDVLHYGTGEFDWVGFYSPITHAELTSDGVFKVSTEMGEYELHHAGDPDKMRVKDVSGKSIFEFQKEQLNEV